MTPFWASGYLDLDPASYDVGVAFWRDVTGWPVSASRGEAGEFATFVPPEGDPHLQPKVADAMDRYRLAQAKVTEGRTVTTVPGTD